MTEDKIMQAVDSAPVYDGANWVQYRTNYFKLLDKKYPPLKAVTFIADLVGMSKEDRTKFYNATKTWKKS